MLFSIHNVESKELIPFLLHTDEKPILGELTALKAPTGNIIRIISSLSPKWKSVGDLLDFDSYGEKLVLIEEENYRDPVACCRDVFQWWLMGNGRQPCTWRKLIEITKECGLEAFAEEIEAALRSQFSWKLL